MRFNLMVRSKGNIIVKDKAVSSGEPSEDSKQEESKTPLPTRLPTSKFPSQTETEYKQCRVLLSDLNTHRADIQQEIQLLERDQQLMVSS